MHIPASQTLDPNANIIYVENDTNWHDNSTQLVHLFEHCKILHEQLKIKINESDTKERKYMKWNLIKISSLASIINNKFKLKTNKS